MISNKGFVLKKKEYRSGDTALWVRMLAALVEDPDLGSRTYTAVQKPLQPQLQGSHTPSWPPWVLHTCGALNIHLVKTPTHIKIKINLYEKENRQNPKMTCKIP